MSDLSAFRNIHAGGTVLLVGNGANLRLTPPEAFDLPSIGMNMIHLYDGWQPTYYVALDRSLYRRCGAEIARKFAAIPKFVPKPKLNRWKGENFYRFFIRPGSLWASKGNLWQDDIGGRTEVTYGNVMHVAIKLACYMGFTTLLVVGMQHKPDAAQAHFWGVDPSMNAAPPLADWLEGYRQLAAGLAARGAQIYNISRDTYVPEDIIPRDDWENWTTKEVPQ